MVREATTALAAAHGLRLTGGSATPESASAIFENIVPRLALRHSNRVAASSFRCTGETKPEIFGDDDAILEPRNWANSMCLFQNLLWTGTTTNSSAKGGTFVFVDDAPADCPGCAIRPGTPAHDKFARQEMPTRLQFRYITPMQVWNASKTAAWIANQSETVEHESGARAHVLMTRWNKKIFANPGHFMGDFMWPTFRAMAELNMLAPDNQIIVPDKLAHYCQQNCSGVEQLLSYFALRGMSQLSPRTMSSYSKAAWFPLVVAGTSNKFISHHAASVLPGRKAFLFRELARITLLQSLSRAPRARARSAPLIRVRNRGFRHRFLNHDAIVKHLAARFPNAVVDETDMLSANREACISGTGGEIRLMMETDILITPGGGGSFGAVYLPDHATAIFGPMCWPCQCPARLRNETQKQNMLCPVARWAVGSAAGTAHAGRRLSRRPRGAPVGPARVCCGQMESAIWDSMSHFHVGYYVHTNLSTLKLDLPPGGVPHASWPASDYSYHVDLEQIDAFVDGALWRAGFDEHVLRSGPRAAPGMV